MADPASAALFILTAAASGVVGDAATAALTGLWRKLKSSPKGEELSALPLLEAPKPSPAVQTVLRERIEATKALEDPEFAGLLRDLKEALAALPPEALRAHDVDLQALQAAGDVVVRRIEGARVRIRDVASTTGRIEIADIGPNAGKPPAAR